MSKSMASPAPRRITEEPVEVGHEHVENKTPPGREMAPDGSERFEKSVPKVKVLERVEGAKDQGKAHPQGKLPQVSLEKRQTRARAPRQALTAGDGLPKHPMMEIQPIDPMTIASQRPRDPPAATAELKDWPPEILGEAPVESHIVTTAAVFVIVESWIVVVVTRTA